MSLPVSNYPPNSVHSLTSLSTLNVPLFFNFTPTLQLRPFFSLTPGIVSFLALPPAPGLNSQRLLPKLHVQPLLLSFLNHPWLLALA